LIFAVAVAVLLTMWFTFTLTRLDRLHARVDAAQAAMDAQLVRRAAALQHVAELPDSGLPDELRAGYDDIAKRALTTTLDDVSQRRGVENAVGRAVAELAALSHDLRPDVVDELQEAGQRVLIARRFYNDAVRDTRSLRGRRMPRLLRMAGRRPMPQFFDIDDTVPNRRSAVPARPAPPAPLAQPATATTPPTEGDPV
jgi:hypothetical protein